MDSDDRRDSEENQVIDVREFLANKVSLALMQKVRNNTVNQINGTYSTIPICTVVRCSYHCPAYSTVLA